MRSNYLRLAALALIVVAAAIVWTGARFGMPETNDAEDVARLARTPSGPPPAGFQQATFAAGCFWNTQVMFQQLNGVYSAVSGYSGGYLNHPTYEQVCDGSTGHAEAVQITFDPMVISFSELLDVFWQTHNPTTRNRQGHDVGPQYRSVIFYHAPEQKDLAAQSLQKLDESGEFGAPIVTEIIPFSAFYPAESYHQNYYLDHPGQGYCFTVIRPKLDRFEKLFKDKLKLPSPK